MELQNVTPLPLEILDIILIKFLAHGDPITLWMTIRPISIHYKARVEDIFTKIWLPRTVITLHTTGDETDFRYQNPVQNPSCKNDERQLLACFRCNYPTLARPGERLYSRKETAGRIKDAWRNHAFEDKVYFISFGENFLNDHLTGGHLINDSALPGLRFEDEMFEMWFDWRKMITNLFKEELEMQDVQRQMVTEYTRTLQSSNQWPSNHMEQRKVLLRYLIDEVQYKRRQKVRLKRWASYYHITDMDKDFVNKHVCGSATNGSGCMTRLETILVNKNSNVNRRNKKQMDGICFRTQFNNDLGMFMSFVVSEKESCVIFLEGAPGADDATLDELYAEEYVHRCEEPLRRAEWFRYYYSSQPDRQQRIRGS